MCIAERDSLSDQVICCIRRVGKAVPRALLHYILAEGHGFQHSGHQPDTHGHGIKCIENRFLVLLHILVISKRNCLHGCQKTCLIPENTSGLAANQLGHIRILLLRHDAASGRVTVIHLHEPVFIAVPENDFLTEARQMHHHKRKITQKLNGIIAIRNRIHTVSGRPVKIKAFRNKFAVQRIGGSCQCARTERAFIQSLSGVLKTKAVSPKHFKISPEVMRQCDRLCLLQMGEARHICFLMRLHDLKNHTLQTQKLFMNFADSLSGEKPHVQRHLIIARTSGVKLLAVVTDPVDQVGLYKAVNILIFICDGKFSGFYVIPDRKKAFDDILRSLRRKNPLASEHRRMRNAPFNIFPPESFVKSDGIVERLHQGIGFLGKSSAPELCHINSSCVNHTVSIKIPFRRKQKKPCFLSRAP